VLILVPIHDYLIDTHTHTHTHERWRRRVEEIRVDEPWNVNWIDERTSERQKGESKGDREGPVADRERVSEKGRRKESVFKLVRS
jgi:hypothetical protein